MPASGVRAVSGPIEGEGGDGEAEGVGGDLGDDGVRALAHVGGALVQDEGAVGAEADQDGGGIGQRGVAAAVPAAGDAGAAAGDGGGLGEGALPVRAQGVEAGAEADGL